MPERTGTILDEIAAAVSGRYQTAFAAFDPDHVELPPGKTPQGLDAFLADGFGLIAEIKNASPSLGLLPDALSFEERLRAYEAGGAQGISILTEPDFFHGELHRLDRARDLTALPLLRKDFIIHPAMVYESYAHGADWVLLIAALLDNDELERLLSLCRSLGMVALLEVHDEIELLRVLELEPPLIGINNRDLRDFSICLDRCFGLIPLVPGHIPVLAESGIKSVADIKRIRNAGFAGALVGEALMRAIDPMAVLREWLRP